MTRGLTRRSAIGLLGTCVLAGLAGPLYATDSSRMTPPTAPMVFRDRNRRDLGDGAAITTERTYNIRFTALGGGFRVEGTQVASSIDAPPELAPLANLWREHVNTGMFPFSLDSDGLVLAGSGADAAPMPGLDQMIDTALAMLRQSGQSETELRDAESFFHWLDQAAALVVSDIPRDLFVPPAQAQVAGRVIELPGGGSGSIDTRFWGSLAPETGLMREATREVVTRTEATSRRIVESWSLLPA